MSQAGQDWTRWSAAAAQDAGLAPLARSGALLLWDADADRPGYGDAAALAMLGRDGLSRTLPAATRQRLALLAGGLAPRDGVRLERLRLTSGFSATPVTCGCKLMTDEGGASVLAIVVPAAELRRLGIDVPAMAAPSQPEAIADAPMSAPSQEQAPAPRRALLRFLWQSDKAGRLTHLSPDMADLVGADRARALPGMVWSDLIGTDVLDQDGGLIERLAASATWSGHAVLWRSAVSDEGVRVELSGVPVQDGERRLAGFRGFGLARLNERHPFPLAADAKPTDEPAQPDDAPKDDLAGLNGFETVAETVTQEAPAFEPGAGPAEIAVTAPALEEPPIVEQELLESERVIAAVEATSVEAAPEADPAILAATADPVSTDDEVQEEASAQATLSEEPVPSPEDPLLSVDETARARRVPGANIVPLRNGHLTAVRPVLEPSKPHLSSAERNAFREIAKALGARIAGDDETGPRLPPVAPLQLKRDLAEAAVLRPAEPQPAPDAELTKPAAPAGPAAETTAGVGADMARARQPNSHADLLDRLPVAVMVNRGDEALYANRTFLDLLDYADLDDLSSGGSVSRLIKEASRTDGGAMILIDRTGHLVSVDAVLSSVSWQGDPATLMAFRHPQGGGEVKVLTPEQAEEAELAAEFAAEEAESGARVEALRLDVDVREARIDELVAMLDTATDGVVTIDERGRMLSLNKTAEALFGYDQREVTGELFTLLFGPESHAPALDYLEGLKGGGVASVMNDGREVMGRVRQGGRIPLFMTMGQIAHGADRRFCAVLRDITAWKKTESELVEARKAAEKASAQKSDVLAKISHEIRTPLNAIIGFAEVMAEERFGPIANERYKEYLRDIHQSGGYVISLVNDLLDLAKIEAGKLDLDFVSVSLNEIALSTVALLQPEAQRGRVVLRSGLSPKLPPVVADQRSIKQIVINLLSNAVKFTDPGGQVIVSTALGDQGEAILRVRDTGIGMDDGEIALALEPFRQVPTTRRKGGTGLGLPLTKALVEANRAAMSITSVKKEGTLVEITFPPQRVLAG